MESISKHISYEEATRSSTAEQHQLDNNPPADILLVMKQTAQRLFEPVREYFGCRIAITSFYRADKVNAILEKNPVILASKKSQHPKGEAMDINGRIFGGVTNREIFEFIRENLDFDQLIWEDVEGDQDPEWIHVSCKADPSKNRHEILKRIRIDGKSTYQKL